MPERELVRKDDEWIAWLERQAELARMTAFERVFGRLSDWWRRRGT